MKRFSQFILLTVCGTLIAACSPQNRETAPETADIPQPQNEQPLNYHALVIGIGDYRNTGWADLGTARSDAEAMGDVLKNRYGFNVISLIDEQATRGNILRAFDQLMKLTQNDALLIYFAGHGYYDKLMDEGYWIPHGAHRTLHDLPAKEDWLWNSSINRIVSASPAKHILLVADTCYGGSLFRGDEITDKSGHWYQRARSVPSRYLITSGNLEPVLDSGIRHSVFAQEILNYLQYNQSGFFSASDIAVSIRDKVSNLTGQLVRMGPLASPAHAGGEFVFVRGEITLPEPPQQIPPEPETVSEPETRGGLEQFAGRLTEYSKRTAEAFIRPRILACAGPTGTTPEETAIVRHRLHKKLESIGGCVLVERDALDTLLKEVELGSSKLADSRAAFQIGKLLPASLILFGEIIPIGENREIHLRIIDTETSRVLSSSSAVFTNYENLEPACETLASEIMKTMNEARPLLLPAETTENGNLRTGWGQFHGARVGDVFNIVTIENAGTISQKEIRLGTARLESLGEEESRFLPEWNRNSDVSETKLWLKAAL